MRTPIILIFSIALGCGVATSPPADPDAASGTSDAQQTCRVLEQDCQAPLQCLWVGSNDDGQCLTTGGLSGRGSHAEGESCTAHAVCEPGLGCFNTSPLSDAGIVVGECRVLCGLSNPVECSPGQTCSPIPGNTTLGSCL